MLKVRVIPVMTFNGVALVKTKQFSNPRMVGNPTQTARVYNTPRVDELIFIAIFAPKQKRKMEVDFSMGKVQLLRKELSRIIKKHNEQ